MKDLNEIAEKGISYLGEQYNLHVLIVSTDTVARPVIRNTVQFNGNYGCDFCLNPGNVNRDKFIIYLDINFLYFY